MTVLELAVTAYVPPIPQTTQTFINTHTGIPLDPRERTHSKLHLLTPHYRITTAH